MEKLKVLCFVSWAAFVTELGRVTAAFADENVLGIIRLCCD